MLCPKCGEDTRVSDTRYDGKENEVFRCHICKDCNHKFFSVEFEVDDNDKFMDIWKSLVRGAGKAFSRKRYE